MKKIILISVGIFLMVSVLGKTSDRKKSADYLPEKKVKCLGVIGSSIAAGWVTSFQEKNDFKNGYAFRLGRMLKVGDYKVLNVSKPGDTSAGVLKRIEKDLLSHKPAYTIIGLSLSNEGIEKEEPNQVMQGFFENMQKILKLCDKWGSIPILGSCYACDDFNKKHYEYIKHMNLKLNSLQVPMINFLGALDDGFGRFPEGFTYDASHPDNTGHEELFYSIVPSMFDSIKKGKIPGIKLDFKPGHFMGIKNPFGKIAISYIPSEIIHSFAINFKVRNNPAGDIARIRCFKGNISLTIKKGILYYQDQNGKIFNLGRSLQPSGWNNITLSHYFLEGITKIYRGENIIGQIREQLIPIHFILGAKVKKADFKDLLIYRSALNQDEVRYVNEGNLYNASLEVYVPLDRVLKNNYKLANLAFSSSEVWAFPLDVNKKIRAIIGEIKKSEKRRENAKIFPKKKVLKLSEAILKNYVGTYKVGDKDFVKIYFKKGHLYFSDRNMKVKIFPEDQDVFFIKYPLAEIQLSFEPNHSKKGMIVKMLVNGEMNLKAVKINE